MVVTLGRLLGVMKAMKKSCVIYAIIDKTHIHILYRGFWLSQNSWKEIFTVCSNGNYITYIVAVDTAVHFDRVVDYMHRQAEREVFYNWEGSNTLVDSWDDSRDAQREGVGEGESPSVGEVQAKR